MDVFVAVDTMPYDGSRVIGVAVTVEEAMAIADSVRRPVDPADAPWETSVPIPDWGTNEVMERAGRHNIYYVEKHTLQDSLDWIERNKVQS